MAEWTDSDSPWANGGWPLTVICWILNHRAGPWRGTYKPFIEQQDCSRCGASRCRAKADAPDGWWK